jgi:hypothetical protein
MLDLEALEAVVREGQAAALPLTYLLRGKLREQTRASEFAALALARIGWKPKTDADRRLLESAERSCVATREVTGFMHRAADEAAARVAAVERCSSGGDPHGWRILVEYALGDHTFGDALRDQARAGLIKLGSPDFLRKFVSLWDNLRETNQGAGTVSRWVPLSEKIVEQKARELPEDVLRLLASMQTLSRYNSPQGHGRAKSLAAAELKRRGLD